ncbi:MAG: small subunit ribosomal protein [Dehalococcoidia bacterium]|nr:small subunit ribosomal protein [Dehalococcoidia bacterium]
MGQKVHPIAFRIGVIKTWQSKWYADKDYTKLVQEDRVIRELIYKRFPDAGVSRIEFERAANQVTATIHAARPGIVIGRSGQRVDELRVAIEKLSGKRVRINIQEIRIPELDAKLVARNIAEQIQRRVAHRRAMRQAVIRTMQRGALGIKVLCAGRLGGSEMSRRDKDRDGRVPLHTLRADIDYGLAEAHTTLGRIGVKVWIYKGDILPERKSELAQLSSAPGREEVEEVELKMETPGSGENAPETDQEAT